MSTLNKYLIKESLIPFLLSLGVITMVLFLQFLIRAVDRFLGKGARCMDYPRIFISKLSLDYCIISSYVIVNLNGNDLWKNVPRQ
ncbi:MAG: hypothetical protein Ct9H300mP18_01150 [Candidatus Neomarinimicrobiota bacterium]|nr:MAG: hypothetical protein Ct9H300mP18_01150 [Candidatus Neomarinimicrobiota bacterium]